jgi:NADP-dependent 3-hydroxy acid dehydrogenase YdfG
VAENIATKQLSTNQWGNMKTNPTNKKMAQRIWLITGASRGFGHHWAEAALKRGDRVAATARDPKALDDLVATYGDSVLALPLDVTDRGAVFKVVNQAHQHFGRLDVILSNAGYGLMGAVEEASLEDARANFETNVLGTLSVIQAALPLLRAQGSGHILPSMCQTNLPNRLPPTPTAKRCWTA